MLLNQEDIYLGKFFYFCDFENKMETFHGI